MSTNYDSKGNDEKNNPNKNKQNAKFAMVAGILAVGILAAALTGGQMLNSAVAQTNDNATVGAMSDNGKIASMPYYHSSYGGSSTVSTSGTATTKVKPDQFSVTVGVETNGTNAQEATSKNADLMAKVIAALKDLGIKESEIGTSNFNVYPVYEYRQPSKVCPEIYPLPPDCQPGQVLTGYRASNSVTVTLDVAGSVDAGKVIDASVQAGANNVYGVYFFVSPEKQEQLRDSLTKDAILNARHRADVAAGALGMQISGVQSVNLNDVYFPYYAKSYDAGVMAQQASTPILPGEQDLTTTVSVVFYFSNGTDTSTTPSGATSTNDNPNCTNPPNGPMIC
ncbi:MAG TPA: SIMPL domain-containing protein [Nitrososphaera sp.]|jgi:hypothetical protein|nr:SIMPL domain-containing protein [Nitrososphaera sp.]